MAPSRGKTVRTTRKPARPPAARLDVLRSPALGRQGWLLHGFSTRRGGASTAYSFGPSLNLGFTRSDSRANVLRNRKLFQQALGADGRAWNAVTLQQLHSDVIHHVAAPPPGRLRGDGLVAATPGLLLAVQVADCVPVLLADPHRRAVGVFHAGWRGTAQRIVEKGVGAMRREFGSRPSHLLAAIGPCIGPCCYTVGPEVRERFESQFDYAGELFEEVFDSDPLRRKYPLLFLTARAPGHSDLGPQIHLDLVEANRRQLLAAGVPPGNITALGLCTACHPRRLFSHRGEQGFTGRMWGAIGICP